jgi:hypothetical protein
LSLEWDCSAYHCVQEYAEAPDVAGEPLVPTVCDYLWRNICRRSALVINPLAISYQLTNTKISDFYRFVVLAQEQVVKFYISVENAVRVTDRKTLDHLPKVQLCVVLRQHPLRLNVLEHVPAPTILRHYKQLLRRLKNL